MKPIATTLYALLLLCLLSIGCQNEEQTLYADYGYVQFRIVKSGSEQDPTRAKDMLDRLTEAHKITVIMQHEGSTITQTLPLGYYSEESAEWGVRSDKLRLLVGEYNIIGYYLYDNLDNELLSGGGAGSFVVMHNGLTLQPIAVDAVERGRVTFRLEKMFSTRAKGEYPFSSIRAIDIMVRDNFTQRTTTLKGLAVEHIHDFADASSDDSPYRQITYAQCDTEQWLEEGNYTVTGYTTYSDNKAKYAIETASIADLGVEFSVADNRLTEDVVVPIQLSATAEYIKDYMALQQIWLALDGPNWTFHGEEYTKGANWNFDKDIDLWGDQPGVSLNAAGRVESLNISGFGARGVVPEAIGQLTELKMLYLGNHNEMLGGFSPTQQPTSTTGRIEALDYYHQVLERDGRECLSEELKRTINSDASQRPITTKSREINLKDVGFGNLTNQITGISRAVMRLEKLEQLFIANSPITIDNFWVDIEPDSEYYTESEEWSWSNFTSLIDIEIYNCPNLTRLPIDMLCEVPAVQSLNISANYSISGEQLKADWESIIESPMGKSLQILYMGFNNLRETPSHEHLKQMVKLGYLDCTNNRLERIHPFGKDVAPATLLYDNNRISEIKAADDGYFCGLSQLETFSCSNNIIEKMPDIFTSRSVYGIVTVNFSSNRISSFENGESWRGVNTSTLNLANNRFSTLPKEIMASGSQIETLSLSGNGIRTIEEGALKGRYSAYLTTIDLGYNRIKELPYSDFSAENLPYLYGLDLSNNAFEAFPFAPLSIDHLTVMSVRCQRDDEGNRTLREWPQGLSNCPRLSAFYIGSNDLRKIEDTISPYIMIFEIKDNPNISIDVSAVCDYIAIGYYLLIYDSTQDIRGCDILNLD